MVERRGMEERRMDGYMAGKRRRSDQGLWHERRAGIWFSLFFFSHVLYFFFRCAFLGRKVGQMG